MNAFVQEAFYRVLFIFNDCYLYFNEYYVIRFKTKQCIYRPLMMCVDKMAGMGVNPSDTDLRIIWFDLVLIEHFIVISSFLWNAFHCYFLSFLCILLHNHGRAEKQLFADETDRL